MVKLELHLSPYLGCGCHLEVNSQFLHNSLISVLSPPCEIRGLKVGTDLDWLLDVGGDDGVQWHPLAHLLDKALDSSPGVAMFGLVIVS